MKLAAHVITALALVALATPAFPCGAGQSHTTAANQTEAKPSGAASNADKGDKGDKVAKTEKLAKSQKTKAQAQKAAATN